MKVHVFGHGRVDLHRSSRPPLFFAVQRVPGRRLALVAFEAEPFRQHPELGRFRDSQFAKNIVSVVITSTIAVDPIFGRLQGPMRRRQSQVSEPGYAVACIPVDVFNELVGIQARRVPILRRVRTHAVFAIGHIGRRKITWAQMVVARPDQSIGRLETAASRAVGLFYTQIPLPRHIGVVPQSAHPFGQRRDLRKQGNVESKDPGLDGGRTGHQHASGRRATGSDVEVGEPEAPVSQRIEVGRCDLAAEGPEIHVPHVVGKDQQDVRPGFSRFDLGVVDCPRNRPRTSEKQVRPIRTPEMFVPITCLFASLSFPSVNSGAMKLQHGGVVNRNGPRLSVSNDSVIRCYGESHRETGVHRAHREASRPGVRPTPALRPIGHPERRRWPGPETTDGSSGPTR